MDILIQIQFWPSSIVGKRRKHLGGSASVCNAVLFICKHSLKEIVVCMFACQLALHRNTIRNATMQLWLWKHLYITTAQG